MLLAFLIFTFVTGVCTGSFLNVVILRSLSGESIVFPGSKCPKCQTPLKWWHNIPVLSYICLRGKCGFCKEPVSIRYPIVELITGIVFVLVVLSHGFQWYTLIALAAACMLIVLAGTDIMEKVVFDRHTYILAGIGLLYSITAAVSKHGLFPLWGAILGILLGILIMEAAARLGYLFAGTRAFGEGDTFIAAALGAIFWWQGLLLVLALSLIIQVIFTLPVFVRKLFVQKDSKTLAMTGVFSLYTVVFATLQHVGMLNNLWVYISAAAILAAAGLYLCKLIISGIKNNPGDLTYLPFGPAMAAAGLLVLVL